MFYFHYFKLKVLHKARSKQNIIRAQLVLNYYPLITKYF